MHGKRHKDETRALMRIKMKGNTNAKGYILTEEQRKKISIANRNRTDYKPLSNEHKLKISTTFYNKCVTKYGKEEADKRQCNRTDKKTGAFIDKRRRQFTFYYQNIEIITVKNKLEAINYCKNNNIPYSTLVYKFKEWNSWYCISK